MRRKKLLNKGFYLSSVDGLIYVFDIEGDATDEVYYIYWKFGVDEIFCERAEIFACHSVLEKIRNKKMIEIFRDQLLNKIRFWEEQYSDIKKMKLSLKKLNG